MAGHRSVARKIVQKRRARPDSSGADSTRSAPVNFFGLPHSKLVGVLEASGVDSTEAKKLADEALGEKPKETLLDRIREIIRKFRLRRVKKKGKATGGSRGDLGLVADPENRLRNIKKSARRGHAV